MLLLAVLAACDGTKTLPNAPSPGAPVALTLTVREQLLETRAARELEFDLQGTAGAGGTLGLELRRARWTTWEADGRMHETSTDAGPLDPASIAAEDAPARRLLGAVVGAPVTISLDPARGVARVEGFDHALDGAVHEEPSLLDPREGLRGIASDAALRRHLAAAGLGAPRRERGDRDAAPRTATVLVPGSGETEMHLTGEAALDERHLPAVQLTGRLDTNATFTGEPGNPPPDEFGTVDLPHVAGRATTSFPVGGGLPLRGEWALDLPYVRAGRALTLRNTTSFTLVLR